MRIEPLSPRPWLVLAAITLAVVAAGLAGLVDADGWRMGVTAITGLALASLMLAMIGSLLRREWLDLVEDELLPAGATLPVCLVLALPLVGQTEMASALVTRGIEETARREAWFADWFVLLRLAGSFALALGFVAAMIRLRPLRREVAMIGLPVVATAFAVLLIDWDLVRAPRWWTPIVPFIAITGHLAGALAITFIYHLAQREKGDRIEFRSLAATLLSLALLSIWASVVQYLIAWYGNLPDAAGWYLARFEGAPGLLPLSALVAGAAVFLLLWSRRQKVMLIAAILMLAAYLMHTVWWFAGANLPDLASFAAVFAVWAAWLWLLGAWYDARIGPAQGA